MALDSVRPFYGFGAIQATAFGINSRYNALQAQVRKSLSNGLFFQAAYTLSKFTRSGGNTDALNLAYDAGRSAYDRPQIFSLLGTYEPPLLKNSSSRAACDLGYGWVFSTNFRALSGVPMGVWMPTDTVGIGHPVRANWAGHVSMPRTMAQWFDPTAFSAPAPLVFGNTPIDAIRGPGSLNFDMGLFRDFKIKERATIQARFEAYNVLNHFTPNNPDVTFGDPTLGSITGKCCQRNLQLGVKVLF